MQGLFERGIFLLSIDTEQIWGYRDFLSEAQFRKRFPDALGVHEKLLRYIRAAGVSATWFLVGGMTLRECAGAHDPRLAGLPPDWTSGIPEGGESAEPLWYHPSFIQRLRFAFPLQEVGLHGGLTHLIWTAAHATREVVRRELAEGCRALGQMAVPPRSFSFARNQEAHLDLLPETGIYCYRGRPPALAWQLGSTLSGALLRVADELLCTSPPVVWPRETIPGLWSIPASLFLYPIGPARTKMTGLRSRLERFRRGLEAAARHRGIFHFCLHPENLAESHHGFALLEDILDLLGRARHRGDVEILTMSDVVARMERTQSYAPQTMQSHSQLFKADWRS